MLREVELHNQLKLNKSSSSQLAAGKVMLQH